MFNNKLNLFRVLIRAVLKSIQDLDLLVYYKLFSVVLLKPYSIVLLRALLLRVLHNSESCLDANNSLNLMITILPCHCINDY